MTIVIVVILVMAVFMPTHAFAGSKDSVEVDLLDISEMPKTAVRQQDAQWNKMSGKDADGVSVALTQFLRRVGEKERE